MQHKRKRYPGVRPFETADKDLFFGRERDVQDLNVILTLEKLIVLFGKSGYGKSSLLNAGLIPWLHDHADPEGAPFIELVVRLGSWIEGASHSPIDNVQNRIAEKITPNVAGNFLSEYLPDDSLWCCLKRSTPSPSIGEGKGVKFLLIFDQFEEFFTYPLAQQIEFKTQLADLLYSDIPQSLREVAHQLSLAQRRFLSEPFDIKILFAIRSDHMSYMDSLKDKLPTILHKRFELKGLSEQQAREAIEKPAHKIGDYASPMFEYSPEALNMIFQKLGKNQRSIEWRGIEAFQLQVLCEYLEEEVIAGRIPHNRILPAHFNDKIDAIYEGYYQRLLDKLPPQTAKAAQRLFEESLIFNKDQKDESRRLSVDADLLVQRYEHEGITYETLQVLENSFLIRREPNSVGGFNYELSHDTLIKAVLSSKIGFSIPYNPDTLRLVNKAKTSISKGIPEKALRFLSKLKVQSLDIELSTLNSRLAVYHRNIRHNTNSWDEKTAALNRINYDIQRLIKDIENALATSTKHYQTIKDYLKKRYSNRLKQKVASRHPINLRYVPSIEGTSEESASSFISYNSDTISGTIAQTFRDANGRLLLLGEKGSGKTTILLQLILELLESEPDRLPILLNLATWSKEYGTLNAWLKKIVPLEIGVSEALASKIIEQNILILHLDGLDEMPEFDRDSFLTVIGEYGADANHQFLISSRIDEYAASKDAPVNAQVEISRLTIEQIETELAASAHLQPESKRLLNALKIDPLLRLAVENLFYLNTAQLLFATGKNWSEFGFVATDVAGRQRELVERFVENALVPKMVDEYSANKARYWLSFLASRMTIRNKVIFELKDIQYDWWHWSRSKMALAGLAFGIVFGLPVGLIQVLINLFLALIIEPILVWKGALLSTDVDHLDSLPKLIDIVSVVPISVLIFALTFGLIAYQRPTTLMQTKKFKNLFWKRLVKLIRHFLTFIGHFLAFGLAGALVGKLVGTIHGLIIFGLIGALFGGLFYIGSARFRAGLVGALIGALIGVLKDVLVENVDVLKDALLDKSSSNFYWLYWLLFGWVFGWAFGLRNATLIQTKDSINWSWKNLIKLTKRILSLLLIFGLPPLVLFNLSFVDESTKDQIQSLGLLLGMTFSLAVWLTDFYDNSTDAIQITTPYQRFNASGKNLYFSILQHKLLRYQLYKQGFLPLHLVTFLNELSARHILETDGATWRFRHRILQEWFAEKWVEPEGNTNPSK